jgi:hypothetical protein
MERKYESTSLVSMWAIYYLAKFPNVLEKLRVWPHLILAYLFGKQK